MIRIEQRGNVQGVKRLILVRVLVYKMFLRALNLAKIPVLIAMIVTPIRFFLELAGLPENLIFIIGLLWLTLAFAVYWFFEIRLKKG